MVTLTYTKNTMERYCVLDTWLDQLLEMATSACTGFGFNRQEVPQMQNLYMNFTSGKWVVKKTSHVFSARVLNQGYE